MSADDICDILLQGKEQQDREKLFFRWCLLESHGRVDVSFDEFIDKMRYHIEPTTKQIMKQQEEIINQFNKGFKKVEL